MKNTKRIKRMVVIVAIMVLAVILFAVWWQNSATEERVVQDDAFDMGGLTRGRVSPQSLSSMMNSSSSRRVVEIVPHAKSQTKPKKRTPKSSFNSRKDEEILMKYAAVRDGSVAENTSLRRGRSNARKQGGVFLLGKKSLVKKKSALHNVKIKVKLALSIRSSSRAPVIAEVVSDGEQIAKGTKFIGTPTAFSNGRTQVRFSEMRLNGLRTTMRGFAISGKDPGIPSDVTDISSNINKTVSSGAIKSVTAIAAGVVGGLSGTASTASNNMISPAGNEVADQKQSNKMQQEFRVPAGTVFHIYVE